MNMEHNHHEQTYKIKLHHNKTVTSSRDIDKTFNIHYNVHIV